MLAQALLWLLTLQVISLVAFPLAYRAFSRLPDRGWTFSKPLGLLLVGLTTWFLGLTHTIPNSRWTVLLALVIVGGLSYLATRGLLRDAWASVRANGSSILAAESLFVAVFMGVVLLRASVPEITHTEQPMDFMFLNAVVVSPHYPPNDPWLAGHAVSYYYFGYLMIGAVTMLTGIATAVTYNLGLATVAALGAIAAFGLTFNLIRLTRGSPDAAVLGGFASVFLLLVASNLGGVMELARAAGAGTVAFWEAVGIDGLTHREPAPGWSPLRPDESAWWWWRISRIIPGTINEFPLFSFLLGDMHPHVMSIGFVLLTAGIATQVYLQPGLLESSALRRHWPLALVAVAGVGGLAPLNLWDLPLGLGLVGVAVLLNAARNERTLQAGSAVALAERMAAVGVPGDQDGDGAVLVYRKRGRVWQRTAHLRIDDGAMGGPATRLGASVALGESVVAAGAPGAGAVHVFSVTEGVWSQSAALKPPNGAGAQPSGFGKSITMWDDTLAVGAPDSPGGGAVYVFRGEEDDWVLEAALREDGLPSDARFGAAIALHGDHLAVTAPGEEAVYVFARHHDQWAREARLTHGPSTPASGFGRSVALGHHRLAVGAVGAAFIFYRGEGEWETSRMVLPQEPSATGASFGAAVALQDPYLIVGAPGARDPAPHRGAVTVFKREDTRWHFQTKLVAGDADAYSDFGSAVAIYGPMVAAGAPGNGQGAAYLFNRVFDKWDLERKLVSRWRFSRAVLAGALLAAGALLLASPFFITFESNAGAVLPLYHLSTRPLHLVLVWGAFAVLVLPLLALVLRRLFVQGSLNWMRVGIAFFIGFAPIVLWLQPIWSIPFYFALIVFLFAIRRAGHKLPSIDEASFAFFGGTTLVLGTAIVLILLLSHGIAHTERGLEGEFLVFSRLATVVPMALVISVAIFAAWTLAFRDSERRRLGPHRREERARSDGYVPVLLVLAFASALIMGVELFHVSDIFGGALRRMNTVFKAYYQAWLLMAVLGGFGLWYVTKHLHLRGLRARLTTTTWVALLAVTLAGVSYYPLAAIPSRAANMSGLTLDGQAYLARSHQADRAEYETIQWIRGNLPRSAVVLESAVAPCPNNPAGCSSYTTAGRISGSTGRPTVLGWEGHQRQWRSDASEIGVRAADVRTIYQTTDLDQARALLAKYGVQYVVVGQRERSVYDGQALAKFEELGARVFTAGGNEVVVYRLDLEAAGR